MEGAVEGAVEEGAVTEGAVEVGVAVEEAVVGAPLRHCQGPFNSV